MFKNAFDSWDLMQRGILEYWNLLYSYQLAKYERMVKEAFKNKEKETERWGESCIRPQCEDHFGCGRV